MAWPGAEWLPPSHALDPPNRIGETDPPTCGFRINLYQVAGNRCSHIPLPCRHVERGRQGSPLRFLSSGAISSRTIAASSNIPQLERKLGEFLALEVADLTFATLPVGHNELVKPRLAVPFPDCCECLHAQLPSQEVACSCTKQQRKSACRLHAATGKPHEYRGLYGSRNWSLTEVETERHHFFQ